MSKRSVWGAIGALVGAALVVPLLSSTAHAYSDTGTISYPTPAGNGSTDLEFDQTCPNAPSTQGLNGWVFTLPAPAAGGEIIALTGDDSRVLYDLVAYIYRNDCTYRTVVSSTTTKDLYITAVAGDRYISVWTANGLDVTVNLEMPGSIPSTTPPNDPLYTQNGVGDAFYAGQWNMRKVRATDAWAEATGSGIKVAVLDTGLDLGHPDFACSASKVDVVSGADPDPDSSTSPEDDEGHGTHVAGIIGACTNNGVGVVGVAPDSTIMPIQVLSATSDAATLEQGIRTAIAEGAHVINMSLSFSAQGVPLTGSALGWLGGLPEIRDAIDDAVAAGIVVVAAAGNETTPICGYPALEYNVVCVGSSDPRDLNSWFGTFPVKDDDTELVGPSLLAPGGTGVLFCDLSSTEIISTYDRSADAAEGDCDTLPGYASIQGTSMASPMVAGIAALVYEDLGGTRSLANANKVVQALTGSAVDLYTPGWDPLSGSGRVDALRAVKYWP